VGGGIAESSIAPTPAPAPLPPLPTPIPTEDVNSTAADGNDGDDLEVSSPTGKKGRVSEETGISGVVSEKESPESMKDANRAETEEGDDGEQEGGLDGEDEGGNNDGEGQYGEEEEEEEEEEEDEEEEGEMLMEKELEELLSSSDRSEDEQRLGVIMKRLLSHQCSLLVGTYGTQDQEILSTLADYPMSVWKPSALAVLVGRLCLGEFADDTVRRFTAEVDLICRNTWSCNQEDSDPWQAAEKFSAMYDRLVKTWILDDNRPSLESIPLEDPCAVCHQEMEKQGIDRITCSRCSISLHKHCLDPFPNDIDDGWFCDDCICLRLRNKLFPQLNLLQDHENDELEVEAVEYGPEILDFCKRVETTLGDWGPRTPYPPLLDVRVNKTVWQLATEDHEVYEMMSGLSLLSTLESSWGLRERLIVLEALCHLAFSSQTVKEFLEKQEQKIHSLRRRVPDDDITFREELSKVGGDVAVLAWKDPLEEMEAELVLPTAVEGEGDAEDAAMEGICCVCNKNTEDAENNDLPIVMCEDCPAEVHLTCIDPNLTEVPEKDWFCQKCKTKRFKKRFKPALRLEDLFEDTMDGMRQKVENQLFEALVDERCDEVYQKQQQEAGGGGKSDGVNGVTTDGGAKGSSNSTSSKGNSKPTKKDSDGVDRKSSTGPTCEYCGYTELELGSPLVYGQSWLETEEHIRLSATQKVGGGGKEGEGGKNSKGKKRIKVYLDEKELDIPLPPLPFFPRATNEDHELASLPQLLPAALEYPIVHEKCAVEMVKLRT